MNKFSNPLLIVTIMFAGGLAACAAKSEAEPAGEATQELSSSEFEFEYYSDDTYRTQVGDWAQACGQNGSTFTGVKSQFVIGYKADCRTNASKACYQLIQGNFWCESNQVVLGGADAFCLNCQP